MVLFASVYMGWRGCFGCWNIPMTVFMQVLTFYILFRCLQNMSCYVLFDEFYFIFDIINTKIDDYSGEYIRSHKFYLNKKFNLTWLRT